MKNASQRMLLNTIVTYSKTLVSAGLSIFSSRWLLMSLGHADYGIHGLIGSIVAFVVFLNTVMAGSVTRHYSFSIGQSDLIETRKWFSVSVVIHLLMAFILTAIAFPFGEYVIRNILVIPLDRVYASCYVYRASLFAAFFAILSIPFIGMFAAKQRFLDLAFVGVVQSISMFTLSYILLSQSGDRLIFYSTWSVVIFSFFYIVLIIRSVMIFTECRFIKFAANEFLKIKQILYFSSWSLVGSLGSLFRYQGSNFLLNIYHGTNLNAAFSIAGTVSSQTDQLSASMIQAFSPEITACEGRGDRTEMLRLSEHACKIGVIMVMFFALPLILEMDYVLKLWLIDPPKFTSTFCRLMLFGFLVDRMSSGYMVAVNAYGKIAGYQMTLGSILILTLPLVWFFLASGYSPVSVLVASLITTSLCAFGRVLWVRRFFQIPINYWLREVFLSSVLIFTFSLIAALIPFTNMKESFFRLLVVTFISIFSIFVSSLLVFKLNLKKCLKLIKG